jgi:hypothetical protein
MRRSQTSGMTGDFQPLSETPTTTTTSTADADTPNRGTGVLIGWGH